MECNCAYEILLLNPDRKHKNKDLRRAAYRINQALDNITNLQTSQYTQLINTALTHLTNNTKLPTHDCTLFTEVKKTVKTILKNQNKDYMPTNKDTNSNSSREEETSNDKKEEKDSGHQHSKKSEITLIVKRGKRLVVILERDEFKSSHKYEDIIETHGKEIKEYINKLANKQPRKYNYLTRAIPEITNLFEE